VDASAPISSHFHLPAHHQRPHPFPTRRSSDLSARTIADTDWERIVSLYDDLGSIKPSAITDLNQAIAIAEARGPAAGLERVDARSEEHTSELQSRFDLVCRLLLEKKTNVIEYL